MREILFRGKRCDNGEFIYGNIMVPRFGGETCIVEQDAPFHSFVYEVDPTTIGQSTGLTDKNGKKIFEGDIIKTRHGVRCVVFVDGCFGARRYVQGIATLFANLKSYNRELNGDWEVIGNIHDNPELLEV